MFFTSLGDFLGDFYVTCFLYKYKYFNLYIFTELQV